MTLNLQELSSKDAKRWDEYVLNHPESTFFHRAGWKQVLEEGLGHKAPFVYAERDGNIVGVLPLGHMKSLLFGNTLSSTPFCVYGGILADDPEASELLRKAACDLAEKLGVDVDVLEIMVGVGEGVTGVMVDGEDVVVA